MQPQTFSEHDSCCLHPAICACCKLLCALARDSQPTRAVLGLNEIDPTVPPTDPAQVIRNYHGHLSGVYSLAQHPTVDILMTGGRDAGASLLPY